MMKVTQVVQNDQRTALRLPGGPIIEILSPLTDDAYCVMAGALPSGACVPLHSHGDAESFYLLSGQAEALVQTSSGLQWQTLMPGDFVHIPAGTKHAWRNPSNESATMLTTCTAKLGRALEEMGQVTSEHGAKLLSQEEALQRFADIAERYGYWLGSPEENAAVGIGL